MKNYRYIIIAATLAAAVSCGNNLGTDDVPDSRIPIKFTVGMATKAFLGPNDLNTAGTELTIWGYAGKDPLIEGQTATYDATEGGWDLGDEYYWGGKVKYKFFSYLTKDKDGHAAPTGITMADSTLTFPVATFDFATTDNDFDFCYSEVVIRPADNASHSTVAFDLKHLYTAIGFSAHNYTGSTITVTEVSLVGLKNAKSASINFADSTKVSYGKATCNWTSNSRKLNSGTITLNPGAECANIVGTASTTPQYYMFWPQTSTELTAELWSDSDSQPSGGAWLKVVYEQGGTTFTRYGQFPQDKEGKTLLGWPAGTKRMIQLAFRDKSFSLEFKVAPWDYTEPIINYGEELTSDDITALSFDTDNCTVDATNHRVYFKSGSPITGTFKVAKPLNAVWVISKEGDFDAFEIDNAATSTYGDGKDCNYGTIDGNDCQFTLYPKVSNTGKTYSIQLSFSVRYANGESVYIDDDIQPVKWTFILID